MNYKDCINAYHALNSIKTPSFTELKDVENKNLYIPSSKFLYIIARNKENLNRIITTLEETVALSADFKKYNEKREELNKKHAKKDENGQPLKEQFVHGDQMMERYIIPGMNDEASVYQKEFNKLKQEFKDTIDEQKQKEESYNSMLKQEALDFKPFTISIEDVPEGLSAFAWDGLIHIIKPEENEVQHKPLKKTDKE